MHFILSHIILSTIAFSSPTALLKNIAKFQRHASN